MSFLEIFSSLQGIVAIIVFFGGSIFVHELGHYLAARWRGLRVLRFSIGFGPKIVSWTSKKSGIEYRISWLPLGGYVALPDLADMAAIEGGDEDAAESGLRVQGSKKRSRKKFKTGAQISYLDRIIVLAAGAAFNVIFAVILAFITWCVPVEVPLGNDSTQIGYVPEKIEVEPGVFVPGPAFEAGLKIRDEITAVDGVPVENFTDIFTAITFGDGHDEAGNPQAKLTVKNAAGTREVVVKPALVATNARVGDRVRMVGCEPLRPARIGVVKNSPAEQGGLRTGDVILSVANADGSGEIPVGNYSHLHSILRHFDVPAGTPIALGFARFDAENPENVEKKTALVSPNFVKRKADSATLRYALDGNEFVMQVLATPKDLATTSFDAPRDVLRVQNSNNPDVPAGTILEGASVGIAGKIEALQTPKDFAGTLGGNEKLAKIFAVLPNGDSESFAIEIREISLNEAVPEPLIGIGYVPVKITTHVSAGTLLWRSTTITFRSIAGMMNPKSDISIKHMNGVFSIGEVYYRFAESLYLLLSLTVMININLAILNLLPIPVLDGGHILIATINVLRRKPISEGVQSAVTLFFMVLLFGLMGYVLLNDWSRVRGNADSRAAEQMELFEYSPEFLKMQK